MGIAACNNRPRLQAPGLCFADQREPMAHLIIGHTTETTARIWVRGNKACTCSVVLHPSARDPLPVALGEDTDFTGVVHVTGLTAGTTYTVEASFSSEPDQKV